MKCDPRPSFSELVILLTFDSDAEDSDLGAQVVADIDLVQARVAGSDVDQQEGAAGGEQLRPVAQLLQDHRRWREADGLAAHSHILALLDFRRRKDVDGSVPRGS